MSKEYSSSPHWRGDSHFLEIQVLCSITNQYFGDPRILVMNSSSLLDLEKSLNQGCDKVLEGYFYGKQVSSGKNNNWILLTCNLVFWDQKNYWKKSYLSRTMSHGGWCAQSLEKQEGNTLKEQIGSFKYLFCCCLSTGATLCCLGMVISFG